MRNDENYKESRGQKGKIEDLLYKIQIQDEKAVKWTKEQQILMEKLKYKDNQLSSLNTQIEVIKGQFTDLKRLL